MMRWVLVAVGIACWVATAWAQEITTVPPTMPPLTTVGAVVSASIAVTAILRSILAGVPGLKQVPVWVYVVAVSGVLTLVANQVTGTLEGDVTSLLMQALYSAAAASGFREWVHAGATKSLAESQAKDRTV